MPTTPRRHPRVSVERTAVVEVRAQASTLNLGGRANGSKTTVPVTLRDVSLGGMALMAPNALIERGISVTVSIQVGARTLSVPAFVVWSRASKDGGAGAQAGLRMQLEVTDLATRKSFEAWVNDLSRVQGARPGMPVPVVVVSPATNADLAKSAGSDKLFDELFRK